MNPHPASYELEGHAAGDDDPRVVVHIATCEACRSYVERSMAAARAEAEAGLPFALPIALPEAAPAIGASRAPRRFAPVVRLAFGLAPLAAAALVFLLVRSPAPVPKIPSSPEVESIHFKGGIQLAVVRQRGTDQERFATSVGVRAFDHLRVEVAVDRERPMTVGVLADDGSWVTLLAPALLGAGSHLSERAADVDAHPTGGRVVAGDPEAVLRARTTRDFSNVAVLEILPEP